MTVYCFAVRQCLKTVNFRLLRDLTKIIQKFFSDRAPSQVWWKISLIWRNLRKFSHIRRGFSSNITMPKIPLNFPSFLAVYVYCVHWYMNRGYKLYRGDRDVLCLHTSPYISGLMWYCSGIWSPHLCGRTHLHVSTNVHCKALQIKRS
jgi:hypothetical protein